MARLSNFCVCFLIFHSCLVLSGGVYVEDNSAVNVSCSYPTYLDINSVTSVRWVLSSFISTFNLSDPILCECLLSSGVCANKLGPDITASITSSAGTSGSTLSISSASRKLYPSHFGNPLNRYIQCAWLTDSKTVAYFNTTKFEIIVKPQPLKCDFQVINETIVSSFCTAENVFPKYKCYGYISKDNVLFESNSAGKFYGNIPQNETPELYNFWCNITWNMFFLDTVNYMKVYVHSNSFYVYSDTYTFTPDSNQLTSTNTPEKPMRKFIEATKSTIDPRDITNTMDPRKITNFIDPRDVTLTNYPRDIILTNEHRDVDRTTTLSDTPSPVVVVGGDSSSDQVLVISLAVATGLFASIAFILGTCWLVCYKLRFRKLRKRNEMILTSASFPRGKDKAQIQNDYNQYTDNEHTDEDPDSLYDLVDEKSLKSLQVLDKRFSPVSYTGLDGPYANIKKTMKQTSDLQQGTYAN